MNSQLHELGYETSDHPDLMVYFLITRDDGENVENCNELISLASTRCPQCSLKEIPQGFEGGTLLIQVIDTSSNEIIMRTVASADLQGMSQKKEIALAREYVKEIFTAQPWKDIDSPHQYALPITSQHLEGYNFANLTSVDFEGVETGTSRYSQKVFISAQNEMRNQLNSLGITDSEEANVTLHFAITRGDDANINTLNEMIDYDGYHCVHCDLKKMPSYLDSGTLVVQLVDDGSKRVVWRAIASADLKDMQGDRELVMIRKYVAEIFNAPPWR